MSELDDLQRYLRISHIAVGLLGLFLFWVPVLSRTLKPACLAPLTIQAERTFFGTGKLSMSRLRLIWSAAVAWLS